MLTCRCCRTLMMTLACVLLGSSLASAQATRTWVSGVGDDANPCSRTAPCKTFAGAISKTAAGGEIDVLDPGGYGAVTITKSITITGESEQSGIVVSGTSAIVVNGSGIKVVLRHLNVNGLGNAGTTSPYGIRFVNGHSLIVDRVQVAGFQIGLRIETGHAIVRNSEFNYNSQFGVIATGGTLTIEDSLVSNNNVAAQASPGATVRLSGNALYNNGAGFGCGGGTIASAGDNRKAGNTGAGVATCEPTVSVVLQ